MNGKEKLHFGDDFIKIVGDNRTTVMHSGEKSLMECLANIVTKNGGDILEIGFGMHLSADEVQRNSYVKSHTIIEVHPEIYERALEWSKNKKNVKVLLGDWIDLLPLENKKFDGILHDTHLDRNILKFLEHIKDNCKEGTIVGFFEYPDVDTRFYGLRFEIEKEMHEKIPYHRNPSFFLNKFELKYTIFDGVNFDNNSKRFKLI